MALTDKLSAIADAIRSKTGKTGQLTLAQMPGEIASITGGGGSAAGCVTVTFMNGNTELFSRPVYIGDDCPNPITQGHIATTPTKESTAQYDYTYSGWCSADGGTADANILKNITADKTVYAAYTSTSRKYTVTFYDDDGTTVLHSQEFNYGATPTYNPTKSGYLLTGWIPALSKVTGAASYTAVWGTVLVVVPEQSVTVSADTGLGGYGQYVGTIPKTGVALQGGATYKAVFDGTEYTVTCYRGGYYGYYKMSDAGTKWKGVYGVGNPWARKYIYDSGKIGTIQKFTSDQNTGSVNKITDSGVPFFIYDGYFDGNHDLTLYAKTNGNHTIYVYQAAT